MRLISNVDFPLNKSGTILGEVFLWLSIPARTCEAVLLVSPYFLGVLELRQVGVIRSFPKTEFNELAF